MIPRPSSEPTEPSPDRDDTATAMRADEDDEAVYGWMAAEGEAEDR